MMEEKIQLMMTAQLLNCGGGGNLNASLFLDLLPSGLIQSNFAVLP